MAIYSFYIFDRHTECVFYKSWVPTQGAAKPAADSFASTGAAAAANGAGTGPGHGTKGGRFGGPAKGKSDASAGARGGDDAKLVFGTIFSLRHMVRKLGGDDDALISYRTGQYKLHYYETPTNTRFVMLTDTAAMSMRSVLHQIYINLWVEYVVKNPLSPVEHKGGEGVTNELFELGLDQFVRGLM
ncbi:hypothetical protein P8C59_003851 [Phyllachora maydis]|uniref:Trafficking protein particle complex subunit n=1 Tax=Phyllachora maydis TaxID=1825666 RepID=A0AAD9M9R6_9PEZI|nr:hypothetical protein P8C59_003851 [Phyllachora maydis]